MVARRRQVGVPPETAKRRAVPGPRAVFRWLGRLPGVLVSRGRALAYRLAFPGGETLPARFARPVRRAAAVWAGRWAEPFFRPDETVVPDPLRPSARLVAAGFAQAFDRAARSRSGAFRLLVCRVPGRRIDVALDAARRRCRVEIRPPAPDAPGRAEAALPPFAPRAVPVRFEIGPDNLRLVLRASPAGVSVARPR